MAEIPPFSTTFAVPLTCESCIKDVSTSLYKLSGIHSVSADLKSQLVSITGTASPSSIVSAIESTGRDAILRGSGSLDSTTGGDNTAAVCILETHSSTVAMHSTVRGLIRMVQVAPRVTILDMTLKGVAPGTYHVSVRTTGNISEGPSSTGPVWDSNDEGGVESKPRIARGILGTVAVGSSGLGSVFLDKPIMIWEMIGRSIVVSKKQDAPFDKEDADTLVGVIARSAGLWDNDKTVCSCSGKTVWEERKEQTARGML